jgi:hypothetical protein
MVPGETGQKGIIARVLEIRAVLTEREAEVAYVALLAAIRAYVERLVQREFHGAVSPGPVE